MAEISEDIVARIVATLRWQADDASHDAHRAAGAGDKFAAAEDDELSRRWTQLADDVAAGRLAELDAAEAAAADNAKTALTARDLTAAVRHLNDTTSTTEAGQ